VIGRFLAAFASSTEKDRPCPWTGFFQLERPIKYVVSSSINDSF
jgi:hypothetical protein